MLTVDLTRLYPEAYHMAADGSWPSIARHGLLSTAALVERWEVASAGIRSSLLEQRRPDSVAIEHPEHGVAIVRDHKPINEASLADALIDMTSEQWFEVLNEPRSPHSILSMRGFPNGERDSADFPGPDELGGISHQARKSLALGGHDTAQHAQASPN